MQALYELAMLKKRLWSEQQTASEQKKKLLSETRDLLSGFLNRYPDSFYAEKAKRILADLPKSE
jgi:outer membrane protein assembly factor BamD (BamD/ComL family)